MCMWLWIGISACLVFRPTLGRTVRRSRDPPRRQPLRAPLIYIRRDVAVLRLIPSFNLCRCGLSGCGRRLRSRLDFIGGVVAFNVRLMMLRTRDAAPGKSVAEQAIGLRRFDVVDLGHGALGVLRRSEERR